MQEMTATTILPADANNRLQSGLARLIDVRTPPEFREVHSPGAISIPLDRINAAKMARQSDQSEILLICRSGARATEACDQLRSAGASNVSVVEGGVDGWIRAGLPVVRQKVISLERQVRLVAGSLVLVGMILGALVNPWIYILPAFIGAGLVFSGVSGFCGMAILLSKAPWNCQHDHNQE
jgi:rhodanese-related sulfurtransferase